MPAITNLKNLSIMSCEICKRIRIDFIESKIEIESASNNVFPHYYEKWEFLKMKKGENPISIADKLAFLFFDIVSGNLHMAQINDNTVGFEYALRVLEDKHSSEDDWSYKSYKRVYELVNKGVEKADAVRQVFGNDVDVFFKDVFSKEKGDFILKFGDCYVVSLGKFSYRGGYDRFRYCWNRERAKVFDYKTAFIVKNCFSGSYDMEIQKV